MKTFNKRGDQGQTSLLRGGRVLKSHPRCEAYGTIDEAVSALGLARTLCRSRRVQGIILDLQRELFTAGAELAWDQEGGSPRYSVTQEMVDRLEGIIDALEAEVPMPREFVIPGGSSGAAALDLGRAILRRAERRAVALRQEGAIQNDALLSYLNRMADLVFVLARYEEAG